MSSSPKSVAQEEPEPVPAGLAETSAQNTDEKNEDDQEAIANSNDPAASEPEPRPESPENAPAADAPPLPNEPVPEVPEGPPLPEEPTPDGPPLPKEPVPEPADDGWDCQWDPQSQAWYFLNRFTGKSQWDNPRIPADGSAAASSSTAAAAPQPPASETPAAGGYNPAIHGDYDPNAWYAQGNKDEEAGPSSSADVHDQYQTTASFNRFTGQFQTEDMGPGRHSDDAKSRRQMNAFFDVDAAANAHDGRSLKAERAGKKPSKTEVKAFKEKRRARKEEKRRAWLRD